jgi:hypothetical protein
MLDGANTCLAFGPPASLDRAEVISLVRLFYFEKDFRTCVLRKVALRWLAGGPRGGVKYYRYTFVFEYFYRHLLPTHPPPGSGVTRPTGGTRPGE